MSHVSISPAAAARLLSAKYGIDLARAQRIVTAAIERNARSSAAPSRRGMRQTGDSAWLREEVDRIMTDQANSLLSDARALAAGNKPAPKSAAKTTKPPSLREIARALSARTGMSLEKAQATVMRAAQKARA